MKKTRIVFLLLTIATFITIFIFSNEDGEKSSTTSRDFTRKVVETLPTTKKLSNEDKEKFIENSQYTIRKLAHFSIYTIVGINLMGLVNTYEFKKKNKISLALLIGVIYAILDEFHQMFSDGRSPQIGDVFIDTLGILLGIAIFSGVFFVCNSQQAYSL